MLTIVGERGSGPFCDGMTRRGFLKIGGLAMGGLAMPQLLAAEAAAGVRRSHKAIIMIYLPGGPPHQDMFDMKPDAPARVRGLFTPIKTNVSGVEICELFPRMAKIMDKLVPIRSIVGSEGLHSGFQCLTGRGKNNCSTKWISSGSVESPLNLRRYGCNIPRTMVKFIKSILSIPQVTSTSPMRYLGR